MSTPNMLLELPTVSVTLGPEWANNVNAAFEVIDNHDHSSDKGARITPSGININANLDISNQIFFNFKAVKFQSQLSTLSGIDNSNSLYSTNGDLYFTNGNGTAVQLTDGGSIQSVPSNANRYETVLVTSDVTIANSDTYAYLIVDTSAARTITLPAASGVAAGRFFIIKDSSGNTEANSITIEVQGADEIDGATSHVVTTNYGSVVVTGDGISSWLIS